MQADNSSHNTAKCRGDLGIGRVGEVLLTVYEVVVDFGVERVSDLADVAGKFDQISAGANFDACEPMGREPLGDGLDVGVGGTKLFAELIRSQPGVIFWRRFALLIVEKLAQCRLLGCASLQQ